MAEPDRHRSDLGPALRVAYHIPSLANARGRRAQRARARHRVVTGDLTDMGFRREFRAGAPADRPHRVRAQGGAHRQPRRPQRGRRALRGAVRRAAHRARARRAAHRRPGLHRAGPRLRPRRPQPLPLDRGAFRRSTRTSSRSSRCTTTSCRCRAPAASATSCSTPATCSVCSPTTASTSCCAATSTCRTCGGSRTCSIVNAGTCCTHRLRGKVRPSYNIIEIRRHDRVRVMHKEPFVDAEVVADYRERAPARLRLAPGRTPGVRQDRRGRLETCGGRRVSRVVALIDGEHYPPVVRFALDELAREHEVVARGVRRRHREGRSRRRRSAPTASRSCRARPPTRRSSPPLERFAPDVVVDLSDEPVLSSADRFELASLALARGRRVPRRGLPLHAAATRAGHARRRHSGSSGRASGSARRRSSAYVARQLKAAGSDVVVLAMGRGGPAEPELIRGERGRAHHRRTCSRSRAQGMHASSDNYEDAVMSRVTTVGCRRCGGGMAGETFFSNVPEGARARRLARQGAAHPGGLRLGDTARARPTRRCSSSAPGGVRRTCATTSARSVSPGQTLR